MSEIVRVVDTPEEVRAIFKADSELERIREELYAVGGSLGGLTKQFRHKAQFLKTARDKLREELRSRKVQLAHEHDWAFPTLELLNLDAFCRQHPGASIKWVPTGRLFPKVEERLIRGELKELGAYLLKCSKCYLEGVDPPDRVAHDCPNCGIARGSPQRFRKSGETVYHASYDHYHCRLCGTLLGYVIWPGIEI